MYQHYAYCRTWLSTQDMSSLAAYLNWDASRREREKLALPEPDDMKTWKQLYKEVRASLSVRLFTTRLQCFYYASTTYE